jgi:hypothetical protein
MAEDYLDPERRAGIEDDIARIKSGELDIETIEDQNYRILLENEMDKAQSVEGDCGMVVDEGNQVESAEQSPEISQDTGVSFDVGEGGKEAGEVKLPIMGEVAGPSINISLPQGFAPALKKLGYTDEEIAGMTIDQQQDIAINKTEPARAESTAKVDAVKENQKQEKIAKAQAELDALEQPPQPTPSEPVKGASQAKPASSDVESTAKIQNFTQFAKENGYPDDYDTSFQAQLLGGRGLEGKRQSNRSIKEQDDAFQEMQNKKAEGKRAYEQAILEGKVIDPDGKLTREGILKREYDFSKKELESKIANAESGIKNIEGLGKMAHLDNGKLKKGYQKAVDDYNETISKHKETLDKLKSEYEQAKSESLLSKEQTPAQKTQPQPSPQKPTVKEGEGSLTKGEGKSSNQSVDGIDKKTLDKEFQDILKYREKEIKTKGI